MTARDRRLRRVYGISEATFNRMMKHQGGRCAICRRPPRSRSLHVDHDHSTGAVRGLLCFQCNRYRVGKNTTETAHAVLGYLLKGNDWRNIFDET